MSTKNKPTRSVWRSLLWKEWSEQKWKLLALTALIFAMPISFLLLGDVNPTMRLELAAITIIPYSILAGLFVGMGTAANEQQRGTLQFLRSQPISMRKVAATKLAMSALTVVVPILALMGAVYLAYPPGADRMEALLEKSTDSFLTLEEQAEVTEFYKRNPNWRSLHSPFSDSTAESFAAWLFESITCGSLLVGSLLIWMAAAGLNRSDEIRAGAVGFLVIVMVWGVVAGSMELVDRRGWEDAKPLVAIPMAAAPGACAFLQPIAKDFGVSLSGLVASSAIIHGVLLFWFVTRYGHAGTRPRRSGEVTLTSASRLSYFRPPLRSTMVAIAWKQAWETGPLALFAAVATLGITAIGFWAQDGSPTLRTSFGEILIPVTLAMGALVTIVAGIGVFLEDMKPRVNVFWRSRPIRFPQWFWIKYVTGLLVLVASFGTLLLLAFGLVSLSHIDLRLQAVEFSQAAALVVLIVVLWYTLAIAIYCRTGHPIAAAMGTIVLFLLGALAVQLIYEHRMPSDSGPTLAYVALATALIAATVAAYRSVRGSGAT